MARLEDMTEDEQDALRDQFAMAALIGLFAATGDDARNAGWAYEHADWMLEARDKAKGGPDDG